MPSRRVPSLLTLVEPVRPRYFAGRLLTADDFQLEQEYHTGARHRMNLALLGAGVVWGLGVTTGADASTVEVAPGMAIDRLGREIIVPSVQIVALENHGAGAAAIFLAYREELAVPVVTPGGVDPTLEPSVIRETFRLWSGPLKPARAQPPDADLVAAIVLAKVRRTRKRPGTARRTGSGRRQGRGNRPRG